MGKRISGPLPAEVGHLQQQLATWRRTRKPGAPTPSDLWASAIKLAIQFGVCRIGRAVGLDYTCLRKQVAKATAKPLKAEPAFVEFPAELVLPAVRQVKPDPDLAWHQRSGARIEISTPDGARMRIILETGKGADASGIVAAFLRQGR